MRLLDIVLQHYDVDPASVHHVPLKLDQVTDAIRQRTVSALPPPSRVMRLLEIWLAVVRNVLVVGDVASSDEPEPIPHALSQAPERRLHRRQFRAHTTTALPS
jgi:hypothetical protein